MATEVELGGEPLFDDEGSGLDGDRDFSSDDLDGVDVMIEIGFMADDFGHALETCEGRNEARKIKSLNGRFYTSKCLYVVIGLYSQQPLSPIKKFRSISE